MDRFDHSVGQVCHLCFRMHRFHAETPRGWDAENKDRLNSITGAVIEAAIEIHSALGPGLLESVYEVLLFSALVNRGFLVERQKSITFEFKGVVFQGGFTPDLIVEHAVVVEIKAKERNSLVFERQVNTYLKILDLRVGLVINFGLPTLKEGIRRVVNNF